MEGSVWSIRELVGSPEQFENPLTRWLLRSYSFVHSAPFECLLSGELILITGNLEGERKRKGIRRKSPHWFWFCWAAVLAWKNALGVPQGSARSVTVCLGLFHLWGTTHK